MSKLVVEELGAQAPENSGPVGGRECAFFGSGAITFGAMMEMLAAEQKIMSGFAELAQVTTRARVSAIQTAASATQNMYENDASATEMQAGGAFAQSGGSFAQAGAGVYSGIQIRGAQTHSDSITRLNSEMTNHPVTPTGTAVGPPTESQAAKQDAINHFNARLQDSSSGGQGFTQAEYARIMKDGGFGRFDLRQLNPGRFGTDLDGNMVTLKDVYESASSDEARAQLRRGLGAGVKVANKEFIHSKDELNLKSQMLTGITSALATTGQGSLKIAEADQIRAKAAEASIQAQAQNNSQIAAETAKAESDQATKMDTLSGQAWGAIQGIISSEYRA